jgi:hypothetical protein
VDDNSGGGSPAGPDGEKTYTLAGLMLADADGALRRGERV